MNTRPIICFPGRPVVPGQAIVNVAVSSNDPTMRATTAGDGVVRIRGEASNNGIIASHLSLSVDGKQYEIGLSRGMSPSQVQAAVAKALPAPYRVESLPVFAHTTDALFRISKPLVAPPQSNDPKAIAQAFAKARGEKTVGGEKVSVNELKHALNVAKKDGFTKAERSEFARQYASLFDGARYHATEAAQQHYATIQKKFDLPVFPVH